MSLRETIYDNSPIFVQNALVSIEGLKRKKMRIENEYFEKWKNISKHLELASEEEVLEFQADHLMAFFESAYDNSAFWRDQFKRVGYVRGQKVTDELLIALPITNKQTMKDKRVDLLNHSKKTKDCIVSHTSGTTGSGFIFSVSKEALAATFSLVWNLAWHNSSLGDRYGTFNGNKVVPVNWKNPPFWRFNRSMNQTLFSIFHMNDHNMEHYAHELKNGNYKFLSGYPSAISIIAAFMYERNMQAPSLEAVYTSSETLTPFQRTAIENAFRTQVFDFYGNGELSVFAYQCSERKYHVVPYFSKVLYRKIGFDESGDELFEPISTSFLNDSTFFINYATGDAVTLEDQNRCTCGRKGRVLKKIIGRTDDLLITPDGRQIGRLDHLFKDAEDVRESQIIQKDIDKVIIKVVLSDVRNFSSRSRIYEEFVSRVGKNIEVQFQIVDRIPRSSNGKFRSVVSMVDQSKKNSCKVL